MAPTRPHLPPLSTPKNMTFPSELRERTYTCLDSAKPLEGGKKTEDGDIVITPPPAYTEFLNTFSPIFASPKSSRANFSKYMLDKPRASPTSASPRATTFPPARGYPSRHSATLAPPNSASYHSSYSYSTSHTRCIKSPKSPEPIRRLRLPPPTHLYTPVTASPRSAYPHQYHSPRYSPSEWRFQQLESPGSESGSFNVRQVVTTTVTFRRTPQLAAPPAGKRKKGSSRPNT
ncbi:hypothetical protein ARAM_006280 [Aspergillus rambellii]|uniref:Uncharacterized protein n=1 Tax=Aspergillus rambellii TaxID=308745 RepID=A0A0F8WEF0_9EURO|nr:hypothetical protein ARAM_006280 [Aspergillus rambellii]